MDPIILFAIAAWLFVRYPATDAVAAYTGHESPRRRDRRLRAEKRHERAMTAGTAPTITEALASRIAQRIATPREKVAAGDREPGPARAYVSEVWRDAWLAAGDRHRTHGDRKAAGTLPRQRAARAAHRAWARTRRPTDGPKPWTEPVRQPSSRDDRCPLCHRPEADHCPDCEACDPDDACRAGTCVIDDPPGAAPRPDPQPEPPAATEPPETPTPDPVASVTPIRPEDITMTAPTTDAAGSGETVDPEQAHAFAQQMAGVASSAASECETSIATLTEHGVTGGPIEQLTAMQEAFETAATTATSAAGFFRQHIDAADQAQAAQQSSGMGGGRYAGIGA